MNRPITAIASALAASLFCSTVLAVDVTIDPGLYKGDYNVGTGWIRGGAVQTFDFPANSTQGISVGGSWPNEIAFHIDANGDLSSDSSRITIDGDTIHFHTVTVDVDPGLYDGRYNMLGYRSGAATLHFVPAGTGSDDHGSQYTLGNGSWPWSTAFRLDEFGNVSTDSTRIVVSGPSITFVTVPTVIDPGNYTGRYGAGGAYRSGLQTVHVMPEGTGTDDFGSRWVIGNGSWPWAISYDVDVHGNILTDSTRVNVTGNTMQFITVPVVLDLGQYEGRWSAPTGYVQGGQHTMHLLPEGTGSMDLGSRWHMSNGAWPFSIGFEIDLAGNVVSDSTRMTVSGNTMTLLTVPIEVDPGNYASNYRIQGNWTSGPQTFHLLTAGSGSMDYGSRWNLVTATAGYAPFDIDDPCAIIPSETLNLSQGSHSATFTVSCGSLIVDSDGDGVADSSDNCPDDANPDQLDQDDDGLGNACDNDLDGDGITNGADNCPDLSNADQADLDGDGAGDACDNDVDGDGVGDATDNCPLLANTDQANGDGDSQGDACDADDDNDGYDDGFDNCPNTVNSDQADTDGDGEGDACDGDVDGDSVGNDADQCPGTPAGLPITEDGCSAQQFVALACEEDSFPNHGRYVSCVSHAAKVLVDLGLISNREKSAFVTQAARK